MSKFLGTYMSPDLEVKKYDFSAFTDESVRLGTHKYVFEPFDGKDAAESGSEPVDYKFAPLIAGDAEVTMTLAEAREEADRVKKEARQEADGILAEAKNIHEQAQAKGRAEGLAKGHAEGLAKGQKDGLAAFEKKAEPTLRSLHRLESLYDDLWKVNEATLVKLAMTVAEQVLHHELSTTPEMVSGAFKAALDLLGEQHQAVFRVNPDDLANLEEVRQELRDSLTGLLKISFEPDPSLKRGDVIMETESGRVDATLKQRLESVKAAIDEQLQGNFDLDW